jgi:ribosomal protein S15P/S13E
MTIKKRKQKGEYAPYFKVVGLYNGINGVALVGTNYKTLNGQTFFIHNVKMPPEPVFYPFLIWYVECTVCNQLKETIALKDASCMSSECRTLRKHMRANPIVITKEEMMQEINEKFEFLLSLIKTNKIEEYLKEKYPQDWAKINEEDI